nr:hypothetical protein [Tanacetum cinerariifolium]
VPQDYDASSATPCLFIPSIYVMYCPYIRSLSVMFSRISFHVLYGRGALHCPSCEQGKSKISSLPPKPVPNSRQRLHLLHMDLCGPMRITSINEITSSSYGFVWSNENCQYQWITVLLQSPVIIIRTDNGT